MREEARKKKNLHETLAMLNKTVDILAATASTQENNQNVPLKKYVESDDIET